MEDNTDIIYALVARGTAVLAECFTRGSGNAAQVTRMILNKIPPDDGKISYESNGFMIHYIVRNTITYLCVAGSDLKINLAFDFLYRAQYEFEHRYQAIARTLKAYEINNEFMAVLGSQISKANQAAEGDYSAILKEKVRSLERLIRRGQPINSIEKVQSIERLAEDNFERFIRRDQQINTIDSHFFWKNLKTLICLFLVLLVIMYLIISMMCGFDFKNCS